MSTDIMTREPCPCVNEEGIKCSVTESSVARIKAHVTVVHKQVVLCGNGPWKKEIEKGVQFRQADEEDIVKAKRVLNKQNQFNGPPKRKNLATSSVPIKVAKGNSCTSNPRLSGEHGRIPTLPMKPLSGPAQLRKNIKFTARKAEPPALKTIFRPENELIRENTSV